MQTPSHSFSTLGIIPALLKILDSHNFKTPTPIQHQSIPPGIEGKDIIGIAQTGTGKTLAFGIPMVHRMQTNKGRGLILLPTRELALQVEETFQKIARPLNIHAAVLIGGQSMGKQIAQLRRQPRVIIATPGRLIDHLQQGTVRLDSVNTLVLDEADRMLDMGFAPQINQVLKTVPSERQTLLFSATMPAGIVKIAASYMRLPVRIEVAPAGTAASKVEQEIIFVGKENKIALLESVLQDCKGPVLVFSRTKHGAKKICHTLNSYGYKAAEIHSNRTLAQRREALEGFKRGKYQILVATDIAARGIDVSNIELVVNFDLPENSDDYVHRIGRTGRAGKEGRALSFATPDQKSNIRDIEKLIRQTLKMIPLPSNLPQVTMPQENKGDPRKKSFRNRKRQNGKKSGGNFGRGNFRSDRKENGARKSNSEFRHRGNRNAASENRPRNPASESRSEKPRTEGGAKGFLKRATKKFFGRKG